MLNLGFRNFRSIFLKNTFLDAILFLYLWLCALVDICIDYLRIKGFRVLAGPLLK